MSTRVFRCLTVSSSKSKVKWELGIHFSISNFRTSSEHLKISPFSLKVSYDIKFANDIILLI